MTKEEKKKYKEVVSEVDMGADPYERRRKLLEGIDQLDDKKYKCKEGYEALHEYYKASYFSNEFLIIIGFAFAVIMEAVSILAIIFTNIINSVTFLDVLFLIAFLLAVYVLIIAAMTSKKEKQIVYVITVLEDLLK